jgi:hypothetical protein
MDDLRRDGANFTSRVNCFGDGVASYMEAPAETSPVLFPAALDTLVK